MTENKKYIDIARHYESCLEKHGDTHCGVDWPDQDDANTRYQIMLDVIRPDPETKIEILDFGCGASHLYEYILKQNLKNIVYNGCDISEKFIELSKIKFPKIKYYCGDVLDSGFKIPNFDYIIMNGVFTEKISLSFDEMFGFFKKLIKVVIEKANIGIAFNVMSKHVDWEREDLFHLPFDMLADYLKNNISKIFLFRNDYGLYEYTTYIYKEDDYRRKYK